MWFFKINKNMGGKGVGKNQIASIENAKALTGLSTEKAEMLFINFWLYSHGIATQIVSNDIDIPLDLVKKLLKNAFNRFSLETV